MYQIHFLSSTAKTDMEFELDTPNSTRDSVGMKNVFSSKTNLSTVVYVTVGCWGGADTPFLFMHFWVT